MNDDFENQDWVKFGVAAALSKQYTQDQRQFLGLLAQTLESALPDETEVIRRGSFFRPKTVQRVSITLNENRYTLEDTGSGPLSATRTRVVRGIALKTETVPIESWVTEIGALLDERARQSGTAREALARLVG